MSMSNDADHMGMPDLEAAGSAEVRALAAHYRERMEELGRTQEKLKAVSCTATAPRQVVSVTVGHGGTITGITFPSSAYKRMTPIDLGKAITETVEKAQGMANDEAAVIMAPTMPAGVDARTLLDGTVDLRTLLRGDPENEDQHSDILDDLRGRRS